MKLYSYDHCPFCVRARMILGFHNIAFEHIILANDDEETPIRLIDKKMLPILVKADGSAMAESMDIVRFIDAQSEQALLKQAPRPQVQAWLENIGAYYNHLVMPRITRIGLAEFADDSAIAYFTRKKTEFIGDFAQNLADSALYIEKASADLAALDQLLVSREGMNGNIDEEDFYIFPILRSLSVVKNLSFPERVQGYMQNISEKTAIPLFFDRAV